eukprot:6204062-Pleurochrysis_carterae.AAC.1
MWVNKLEGQNMNGAEAETIHKARELIMESTVTFAEHMKDYGVDARQQKRKHTWKEFLKRAGQRVRGRTAVENVRINIERTEASSR